MNRTLRAMILLLAVAVLAILPACSAAATPATPTLDPNMIYTQAVLTVESGLTQTAAAQPTSTATPEPTATLEPSPTLPPPPTQTPFSGTQPALGTLPVAATATNAPAAVASPVTNRPGDHAAWQSQSPGDGASFDPGQQFTLMFSLLNSGTTTWTTSYRMTWVGGTELSAAHNAPLAKETKPGEKGEFYFSSFAPMKAGTYKSTFYVYNSGGASFYEVYFTFKVK